jgi:GntR family transcriptional regulator, rspAB operon transcriptional repressor
MMKVPLESVMASTDIYRTISEQIAQQLRNEILSGQLAEGEPLPGEKLAKRFGVSRGPIRDAVMQLTHEGLLVSEPNVGVKVAGGPNPMTHRLVICIRRLIETFALENVFEQLTDDDIHQLGEVLERLRVACERDDLLALVGHDMTFHRLLIERTGDQDLLAIWRPIVVRMMLRYSTHQTLMETYEDHRLIYQAVRARDKKAALKALASSFN